MSADKPSADQQTSDEAARKARNPNASKQTIADSQAKPEFQINRERLKAERLAREAQASTTQSEASEAIESETRSPEER